MRSEQVKALHEKTIVVDAHHDIALDLVAQRRLGNKGALRDRWLPALRQAGIKVQVFPVFTEEQYLPELALRRTLEMLDALLLELEECESDFAVCLTGADIDAAVAQGKIAAILAVESLDCMAGDLSCLRVLWRQGVRMCSLTWNGRNHLADGVGETGTGGGLTNLGRETVKEMARLGMVVDVSHLSEAGVRHVLETTTAPVVATHSNARAVCDHPRNLTDDQIRAIAARGGVVGMLLHPGVIGPDRANVAGVIDHINYIRDLVGITHVGLGTDLLHNLPIWTGNTSSWLMPTDLAEQQIDGLGRIEELPNLTEGLLAAGYTEEEIAGVLGHNFLRVLRQIGIPASDGQK